jgi:hypothetical protein
MLWHVKIIARFGNIIRVAYCYESSDKYDGVIEYNVETGERTVKVSSDTSDEYSDNKLLALLRIVYREGNLTEKPYHIATG